MAAVLALLQGHVVHADLGPDLVLSLWLGAALGVVLQRTRLCFYCDARDFLERRDARGLWGITLALALGTLGYHAVFGAFLPAPELPRLPPNAHIGPVSWVLVLGALAFGLGMALAGSCISAQLYRLGEGALGTLLALAGTVIGFALGFLCWNTLYLNAVHGAPVLWLPHHLGYGGSLLLQLALLGGVALVLLRLHRTPAADAPARWWPASPRWPSCAWPRWA
nr:YeeE/YedE thiosulfate transporter family protein [Comamonas serinivorans]